MITNDWLSLCSGSSQGCASAWNHLGSTPTTEVLQVWYNLEWKFVPGDLEKVGGGGEYWERRRLPLMYFISS